MRIINCTMFFNEFDLLDLKIAEELPNVDEFIIVEANQTHIGSPKQTFLKDNSKYKDLKIITLENEFKSVSEDLSIEDKRAIANKNEAIQRNAALRNLDINDDDVIICSDLDEIIPSQDFKEIIECTKEAEEKYSRHIKLQMYNHLYKINLLVDTPLEKDWFGPFAVTGKLLKNLPRIFEQECEKQNKLVQAFFEISLDDLRQCPYNTIPYLPTNGRHFSCLGEPKDISYKLKNYSQVQHSIEDIASEESIISRINNLEHLKNETINNEKVKLKKVEIDATYPETIIKNLDKWQKYIY